ncbi:uncharacterized protein LOC115207200 [Salmo trutta]|uniref:uncharacterized protein LOC115207200 n=1 Tax=Salmo trutta TaxID=8032 RepID=UPI001130BBC8|nr:uncharacterized protein LOC115207200 [Salmo trutta]
MSNKPKTHIFICRFGTIYRRDETSRNQIISTQRPLQHRDPATTPSITSAMIYYKEHLTLTNKLRKPVVEKLRRDQIKSSIEHLRSFLGPEILNQQPVSKLEKADILELTGCFLRQQQQYQLVSSSSCSGPVNQGYSTCVKEIVHFLSKDEVKKQSQRRLLSHFQSLQPSSDKNQRESDLSQLSSLAQHSIMCISMITSSEGSELEVVTSYKYLGVWLDSTPDAEKLIHAFIFSRIDYSNVPFGDLLAKLLQRCQLIQNSAARVLTRTKNVIDPNIRQQIWEPPLSQIHTALCDSLSITPYPSTCSPEM